jgi:hypothetical protein
MLFKAATLAGIKSGAITLAFRRWDAARSKAGGSQKTRIGVVAFTAVEAVAPEDITEREARAAGFAGHAALLAELDRRGAGNIYRIGLKLAGPDPRIALQKSAKLSDEERGAISGKLARLDRAGAAGPWTLTALRLIAKRPATRAVLLARSIGWERAPFKLNIRKLKAMGLTESLEIGYRLSPRGKVVLKDLEKQSATARSSRRRP